jgi:hypothetical protein
MKRLTIRNLMIFALSGAFLCGMAISASATSITTYIDHTGKTAWESAVGSFLTENFNDTTLNDEISGIQSDAADASSPAATGIGSGVFQDVVWSSNTPEYETTISFSPELLAWGATFNLAPSADQIGEGINIYLYSGTTKIFVETLDPAWYSNYNNTFFGFTSTLPFDRIVLAGAGCFPDARETYTLDNMQYAPVPEPATMLLVGSGLLALGGFRRIRKRM